MAGWASANKYSLMGALRAAGQLIAYELPMVLGIMGVVVQAGTMSLPGIVLAPAHGWIFGFGRLAEQIVSTPFCVYRLFLAAAARRPTPSAHVEVPHTALAREHPRHWHPQGGVLTCLRSRDSSRGWASRSARCSRATRRRSTPTSARSRPPAHAASSPSRRRT